MRRTNANGKSLRKVYGATAKGRDALQAAKEKVRELFSEMVEEVEGVRQPLRLRHCQ